VKRWLVALGIALMPLTVWAGDWSQADITFEATYLTLHVVDWGQTLNIVERHEKYHEVNPILGRHPSRDRVNTYFALAAVAHVALANWLDAPARTYFQIGSIALEASVIGHNYQIGLHTSF
jgi:hypothetical protein